MIRFKKFLRVQNRQRVSDIRCTDFAIKALWWLYCSLFSRTHTLIPAFQYERTHNECVWRIERSRYVFVCVYGRYTVNVYITTGQPMMAVMSLYASEYTYFNTVDWVCLFQIALSSMVLFFTICVLFLSFVFRLHKCFSRTDRFVKFHSKLLRFSTGNLHKFRIYTKNTPNAHR